MKTHYDTPQASVEGLIAAYQSLEVDNILSAKNFEVDAKLFFQDMGLPMPDDAADAFRNNLRLELDEGIRDYRESSFSILSTEMVQDDVAVVTLDVCQPGDESYKLALASYMTGGSWNVVLHPDCDHL